MGGGWFIFAVVTCIVVFTGFILAVVFLKAAWTQRERDALSSSDLRALEESAVLLVEQLRVEADRGIAELDSRCNELRRLTADADKKLLELRASMAEMRSVSSAVSEAQSHAQVVESLLSQAVDDTRQHATSGLGSTSATTSSPAEARLRQRLSKITG